MDDFNKAKMYRQMILATAAMVVNYSWDDATKLKELKAANEPVKGAFDPNQLTKEQLTELGFASWSDDLPIYLIPLWAFGFIREGIEITCINGKKSTFDRKSTDNDVRFGCIAYGVYPKQ